MGEGNLYYFFGVGEVLSLMFFLPNVIYYALLYFCLLGWNEACMCFPVFASSF